MRDSQMNWPLIGTIFLNVSFWACILLLLL